MYMYKLKKILYKFASNDLINVLLAVLALMIGFVFFGLNLNNILDWKFFYSIVVFFIFYKIVDKIQKIIFNLTEDAIKLTEDYDWLISKYYNVDFISINDYVNSINKRYICIQEVKRFNFGEKIRFIYTGNKYQLPKVIDKNFDLILNSHSTSKINNALTVRIKSFDNKTNTIELEDSSYYDTAVTNLAADYYFKANQSVRELYEPGPFLSDINTSRMGNRFGYDCFYMTNDNYLLFAYRNNNKIMAKNTFTFSFSNNIKYNKYNDFNDMSDVSDNILNSIYKDIINDIKFCDKINIELVSLYRDIQQCGLPKLFFLVRLNQNFDDIQLRFNNTHNIRKNNKYFWININNINYMSINNNVFSLKDPSSFYNKNISILDFISNINLIVSLKSNKILSTPAITGCLAILKSYLSIY